MGDAARKAKAFAEELAGGYPTTAITAATIRAWATAFTEIGLDIADDVSALLRHRSTFPPSVAQILETAREVRKETMSEWSTWDCVFADGVPCPQCSAYGETIIHGRLLSPTQLREHLAGIGWPA